MVSKINGTRTSWWPHASQPPPWHTKLHEKWFLRMWLMGGVYIHPMPLSISANRQSNRIPKKGNVNCTDSHPRDIIPIPSAYSYPRSLRVPEWNAISHLPNQTENARANLAIPYHSYPYIPLFAHRNRICNQKHSCLFFFLLCIAFLLLLHRLSLIYISKSVENINLWSTSSCCRNRIYSDNNKIKKKKKKNNSDNKNRAQNANYPSGPWRRAKKRTKKKKTKNEPFRIIIRDRKMNILVEKKYDN